MYATRRSREDVVGRARRAVVAVDVEDVDARALGAGVEHVDQVARRRLRAAPGLDRVAVGLALAVERQRVAVVVRRRELHVHRLEVVDEEAVLAVDRPVATRLAVAAVRPRRGAEVRLVERDEVLVGVPEDERKVRLVGRPAEVERPTEAAGEVQVRAVAGVRVDGVGRVERGGRAWDAGRVAVDPDRPAGHDLRRGGRVEVVADPQVDVGLRPDAAAGLRGGVGGRRRLLRHALGDKDLAARDEVQVLLAGVVERRRAAAVRVRDRQPHEAGERLRGEHDELVLGLREIDAGAGLGVQASAMRKAGRRGVDVEVVVDGADAAERLQVDPVRDHVGGDVVEPVEDRALLGDERGVRRARARVPRLLCLDGTDPQVARDLPEVDAKRRVGDQDAGRRLGVVEVDLHEVGLRPDRAGQRRERDRGALDVLRVVHARERVLGRVGVADARCGGQLHRARAGADDADAQVARGLREVDAALHVDVEPARPDRLTVEQVDVAVDADLVRAGDIGLQVVHGQGERLAVAYVDVAAGDQAGRLGGGRRVRVELVLAVGGLGLEHLHAEERDRDVAARRRERRVQEPERVAAVDLDLDRLTRRRRAHHRVDGRVEEPGGADRPRVVAVSGQVRRRAVGVRAAEVEAVQRQRVRLVPARAERLADDPDLDIGRGRACRLPHAGP